MYFKFEIRKRNKSAKLVFWSILLLTFSQNLHSFQPSSSPAVRLEKVFVSNSTTTTIPLLRRPILLVLFIHIFNIIRIIICWGRRSWCTILLRTLSCWCPPPRGECSSSCCCWRRFCLKGLRNLWTQNPYCRIHSSSAYPTNTVILVYIIVLTTYSPKLSSHTLFSCVPRFTVRILLPLIEPGMGTTITFLILAVWLLVTSRHASSKSSTSWRSSSLPRLSPALARTLGL